MSEARYSEALKNVRQAEAKLRTYFDTMRQVEEIERGNRRLNLADARAIVLILRGCDWGQLVHTARELSEAIEARTVAEARLRRAGKGAIMQD